MQTFLPLPNFSQSAQVLDSQRLGKQRVEARQILKTLQEGGGWLNHPAVRMWEGFELALTQYGNIMIAEWVLRGNNNNMPLIPTETRPKDIEMPPWFGDDRFHASHRSNLLRKDWEHYRQFSWTESVLLPYWWPTEEGKEEK